MKIGLIGTGVVGTAFYENMKPVHDIVRYDKNKDSDVKTIKELVSYLTPQNPIFVSVPTPMSKDGTCDIGIVDSVCYEINEAMNEKYGTECNHTDYKQIVVIRSTVVPETTENLNKKYKNLCVVFNPEFLTESNAINDFKHQNRIIIGGDINATKIVASVYRVVFPYVKAFECSSRVAELTKYITNCFLATKVAFANEIYQVCEALNVDYNEVVSLATLDHRLGKSHWKVPGNDQLFGFGGKCLPKDLSAIIEFCQEKGINVDVMKTIFDKNLKIRGS